MNRMTRGLGAAWASEGLAEPSASLLCAVLMWVDTGFLLFLRASPAVDDLPHEPGLQA